MTAAEAAKKWGTTHVTVKVWIRKGLVPAEKVSIMNVPTWIIPDDAQRPSFQDEKAAELKKLEVIPPEQYDEYIWQNQAKMTIGQLRQKLGLTLQEIKDRYDAMLEAGRRDFPYLKNRSDDECL